MERLMDIGIFLVYGGQPGLTLTDCARTAKQLEDYGFSSLWAPDHVVTFESYQPLYSYSDSGQPPFEKRQGFYDPLWVLAAAAGATSRIRLGTCTVILPERNPVVFAAEVVGLDHLSNGRVDLGVGIGWSPEEYAAVGVPFLRRGARASEYIAAMRLLWTEDVATMESEFVNFKDVVALPKPLQQPCPPIIVGGQSHAALRRVARQGDGWISWLLPEDKLIPLIDALKLECEKVDRDPASVRMIGAIPYNNADNAKRYFDMAQANGMHEFTLIPWPPTEFQAGYPAEKIEEMAKLLGK